MTQWKLCLSLAQTGKFSWIWDWNHWMGTNSCNPESSFPRIPRMVSVSAWFEPYLDILVVYGKACCFLFLSFIWTNTWKAKARQVRKTVERRTHNVSNPVSLIAGSEAQFFFKYKSKVFHELVFFCISHETDILPLKIFPLLLASSGIT